MKSTALSPAKLNLFLHITGRDFRQYHVLESLFSKLQLADQVTITLASDISCQIDGPNQSIDIPDNLAMSAAQLLKQTYKVQTGANIHIQKNIPIGAGLGGASSNAATTMLLLNQLWNLNLPSDALKSLATSLGSDIAFFLQPNHAAMVFGTGEIIKPVTLDISLPLLLVYPGFPSSTSAVYNHSITAFTNSFLQPYKKIYTNREIQLIKQLIYNGHNDLYAPASYLYPNIKKVIQELKTQPGCLVARMSGSGSSCFSIFTDYKEALNAAEALTSKHPTWFVYSEILSL